MIKLIKKICFLTSIVTPMMAFAAVCENWSVTMGSTNNENGVWNFTQGHDPGEMLGGGSSTTSGGGTVHYSLDANVERDGLVLVQRTMSTDGNDCIYNGTKTGNAIKGTFLCDKYTPAPEPWQALVSYCLL